MPSPVDEHAWLARTGPMASPVDDIALFLEAVAGPDPRVGPPAPVTGADFAGFPDFPLGDLRGLRIGWSPDLGVGVAVEREVLDVLTGLLGVFEDAGAVVEEAAPDLRLADRVCQVTRAREFAAGLGGLVRDHRELVKPEVVWNVELGWSYTAEDLAETAAARARLGAAVADYFTRYDLFLCPGAQVLPFDATQRYPAEVAGVPYRTYLDWMRSACLLSAAGLPVLAMPAGFTTGGLPVGFQLAADHYRDIDLLRWARVFEAATGTAQRRPDWVRPAAPVHRACGQRAAVSSRPR